MSPSCERFPVWSHRLGRVPRTALFIGALVAALPWAGVSQTTGSSGNVREEDPPPTLETWARAYLESAVVGPSSEVDPVERRVDRIRAMYHLGVGEPKWVNSASDSLAVVRASIQPAAAVQVVLAAYEGALRIVRAKHARWPPNKLKFLREGSRILDDLAAQHPEGVEIRYLRYASYRHLPFFLDRPDTVREDLDFLVTALSELPEALPPMLYRGAIRFILEDPSLDSARIHRLEEAGKAATGSPESAP